MLWLVGLMASCSPSLNQRSTGHSAQAGQANPTAKPGAASNGSSVEGATAHVATTGGPDAPHQASLRELQHSEGVLPPKPPVHPIHTVYNREAIIPPMCYTRTEGQHNPCYVCHQTKRPNRPNTMDDGELQRAYSFSELGGTNHWHNLFEDRRSRVAQISDAEIREWVEQDNYSDLAPRLRDAGFKGYVPDLADLQRGAEAFDEEGFAKDGSHWVAFSYKPLPSTFWPTNGATDDVMIRLPEAFRTDKQGNYSRDIYKANLALVEAGVKGLKQISVRNIDERIVGVDLDGDGALAIAERITRLDDFVGAAQGYFSRPHLYPLDTEFLHSVRYLGVGPEGQIYTPPRMKELRYMRKRFMLTLPQLYDGYLQEGYAKDAGELPGYINRGQYGLDNGLGWVVAGFIENRQGKLRFNTFEENMFCMGCHTSLGSTIDQTFAFPRKVDGAAGWGYLNLHGMPDAPNMGEQRGEIATYLERAGGGGEFRSNPEMAKRWFQQGRPNANKLERARDVYELITPSASRALELNKAYRVIVDDQDYLYGRDATAVPPKNVYNRVDNEETPTLPVDRTYLWDIRLDWAAGAAHTSRPSEGQLSSR